MPRPIFVLIPHLSYINTGLLVPATGATAANQYLRSGHRYSQTNSSLDIFTIANPESPQSHRNAMHKYSDPPESNMDLDLSKTLISLQRTLFTFLTFPILVRRKFTASRPPLSLLYIRSALSHSHKTDPMAERLPLLRPFSPKLMWQKESLMVVWRIRPQKESVGWFLSRVQTKGNVEFPQQGGPPIPKPQL